jgi:hypothetical protein
MTSFEIEVLDVRPQEHAAAPHLLFRLRLTESTSETVHAVALRCQLRIEPQLRGYDADEQSGVRDLFGEAERYPTTLKPFLWAHAVAMVQGFVGSTEVELPVPCSYDFDVSAAKYLHALRDGDVPLLLLFSGTVFTRGASGFTVEQLPWSLEARCRLPVSAWRQLMDAYFPGGGWIRLSRESIDALGRYRSDRGLTGWDQTVDALIAGQTALHP